MKSYWISYTTKAHPGRIETDEFDFEDTDKINQETIYDKIISYDDYYNVTKVDRIIAWSKIED
jgi:hypothetical protein